jgi:hypothetical protein
VLPSTDKHNSSSHKLVPRQTNIPGSLGRLSILSKEQIKYTNIGPGAYNIPRLIGNQRKTNLPTNAKAKRFQDSQSLTPGPGQYFDSDFVSEQVRLGRTTFSKEERELKLVN